MTATVNKFYMAECDDDGFLGSFCDTEAQANEERDAHNARHHGDAERQAGLTGELA